MNQPEEQRLVTGDDLDTELRTVVPGAGHDFRARTYDRGGGSMRTSWVCIWCNGVACGDYDDPDPCWHVYHHRTPHRSRSGVTWPIGGDRPPRRS